MAKRQKGRNSDQTKVEQLEALRGQVTVCEAEAAALLEEEEAVRATLTESEETLVKTLVHRRSAKAEQKAFEAARERATEPWPQKHEAARRRVALAKEDVNTFIGENYDGLVAELRPRADAARERIEAAFAAAAEATGEWHAVVAAWEDYALTIDDPQRRAPDSTGLDERIADLRAFTVPDPIGSLSPGARERLGGTAAPPENETPEADAAPEPDEEPADEKPPPRYGVHTLADGAGPTNPPGETEPFAVVEPEPEPEPEPALVPEPEPEPAATAAESPAPDPPEPVPPAGGELVPAPAPVPARRKRRGGWLGRWRSAPREQLP